MDQMTSIETRILAVELSTRGFGFAVMEGEARILECGVKEADGNKNAHSLAKLKKLIGHYQPEVLALRHVDAKGSRRGHRIKRLHRQIIKLASKQKLRVKVLSDRKIKRVFFGAGRGTKYAVAEAIAQRFPEELGSKLPPMRRFYEREDRRMDMFGAMALALAVFDA